MCSNYRGRRRLLAPSANVIPPSLALIHSRGPCRSGAAAGLCCEHGGGVKPRRLWAQGRAARWKGSSPGTAAQLRSSLVQDCLFAERRDWRIRLIYDGVDYCHLQAILHFILKLFLCVEDCFAMVYE